MKDFHPVSERFLLYVCTQATESPEDVRLSVPYLVPLSFLWFVEKAQSRDYPPPTGAYLQIRISELRPITLLTTTPAAKPYVTGTKHGHVAYKLLGGGGQQNESPHYSHPHCSSTRTQVPIIGIIVVARWDWTHSLRSDKLLGRAIHRSRDWSYVTVGRWLIV